ncbi:MAG TPA: hypothetical protein GX010_03965 [Erysipelotrichaceae bacterium]|nr:hypothetical protein [Erysipelotrichaceae bacterium]
MVKKIILNNINEFMPSSNGYGKIKSKLDFDGFQTDSMPKKNKKKGLGIIIPVSVLTVACIASAVIIPTLLKKAAGQSISLENSFFTTKNSNQSLAICEAIYYPKVNSNYKDLDSFNVDVMVANLYYGKRNDGSVGLFVGTEERPGYSFDAINISLNNAKKELIKQYHVDMSEYSKQENGIRKDKSDISRDDFKLVYSFNLIELFDEAYNGNIQFEINYIERENGGNVHIFGKSFSLHLNKNHDSISLDNFETEDIENNQLLEGDVYYMDVIDALSGQSFDYENPNYAYIQIHAWDSRIYVFDNPRQVYEIISNFNSVPLHNIVSSPSHKEELRKNMVHNGMRIVTSYRYSGKADNSEDAVISFIVCQDGTLALTDNRDIFLFYSESNAVDYSYIVGIVKEMDGD